MGTEPSRAAETPGTHDATPNPGAEALVDALAQSAFAVMGVLTRIAAEHEMSLTQLRVLGILRDRSPRMAELADYLGLERSTMSGLVDRAERRGLLGRGKNPDDARAVDVFMTSAGLELAVRVEAEIHHALAPITRRLDAKQRRALTRLLERMLGST
ncbi:MAG: MarR family transcriptional regulator [Solirubrobacterales bacterium]|nr:MarR family transcriptional regulator [Solirubrobacterales bacterium]